MKGAVEMAAMNLRAEDLARLMQEGKTVLVDYWAPWCGYCRRIAPAYDKIAERYADLLVAGKINIDDEPQLAHREAIEVIPTLVLYKNGEALGSVVAPESITAIQSFIHETLGI
jgi:thioredoxin